MNYQKIYICLIEKAKQTNTSKLTGIAYEKHHIIPKCCGGSNDESNLVMLTCRQHFIAHRLLVRVYKDTYYEYPLSCATWRMAHTKRYKKLLNSRSYQLIRNDRLNLEIPNEIRTKMSNSQRGRKHSSYSIRKRKEKLLNRLGYNDGIKNIFIKQTDPIPENFIRGIIRIFPEDGSMWINNGFENKLWKVGEDLPPNYSRGYLLFKYREANRIQQHKGQRRYCITNGSQNRQLYEGETIPNGWRRGWTEDKSKVKPASVKTRQKLSMAAIGKVWANNGKQNIFVYPNEVPSNFTLGRMKGKIWVHNETRTMLCYPNQIPDGYQKGLGRKPWNKK